MRECIHVHVCLVVVDLSTCRYMYNNQANVNVDALLRAPSVCHCHCYHRITRCRCTVPKMKVEDFYRQLTEHVDEVLLSDIVI